jgi:hypothetical protein
MPKYVLMFHGGETPDEPTKEVMDSWMAWFGNLGDAIVDVGSQFGEAKTIYSDGTVKDGGGLDPVTGYTVIEAENMDKAVTLGSSCPGLLSGGSVKLFQAMRMD